MKKILLFFKSLFLNGLFTILPIAFTLFFLNFIYNFVYRSLNPLKKLQPTFLRKIPGVEFLFVMVFILLIGFLLKIFILDKIIKSLEELVAKIPFVRAIYSSAKMVVDFFRISEKSTETKKVVLIQYPRKGNYHLAFLLESAADSYQKVIPESKKKHPNEPYVKVFMPNSPNPTTGYFFILPEDEIIHTNITFEECVKTLVSCGLITPESLKGLSSSK
jgi:uncharacterized membrane protein